VKPILRSMLAPRKLESEEASSPLYPGPYTLGVWLERSGRRSSSLAVNNVVRQISLLLIILLGGLGSAAQPQDASSKPDDKGPKKAFSSAKDRLAAMHMALLYAPRASPMRISSPVRAGQKQFQLHFNDKVICDFATPGRKWVARRKSLPARSPVWKRQRGSDPDTRHGGRTRKGEVRLRR
jgi:hypothetical protein